jgi:hypothetical protein
MKTLFKVKSRLSLLLALLTPASGFAASNYCIATNGGFGNDGTTFIGPGFAVPSEGKCTPWTGFTKTASTVIVTTYGTGCLSSDGTALTVAVSSADPNWFGAGTIGSDYIQLTRSKSGESFTTGSDQGAFGGDAEVVSCTSSLLDLPSNHD